MARKAIAVTDDNGIYTITGRRPVAWTIFEKDLWESYADEQTIEVDYEPLMGWQGWTFGILVNGSCVGFVDGNEPPTTVLARPLTL